MRILSVDDSPENLYLIEMVVRAHGYEVTSACNGREALEQMASQSFDLIVSDVLMPEMDGFQLCRAVKSDERTRNIPFIFYTATYTAKQDEELGLALGASRFIIKPMDPEQFTAVIDEVLQEGSSGRIPVPSVELEDEGKNLSSYNQRLVRKLEQKIQQLEVAYKDLARSIEEKNAEIAQRRLAEAALQRSEEQFRLIWDQSMDGMRLCDLNGTIVRVNGAFARMFARAPESLAGQPLTCCFESGDAQPLLDRYRDAIGTRSVESRCDVMVHRWDGVAMWLECSSAIIEFSSGPFVFSIFRDVTNVKRVEQERTSLQQQLQQAQKLESIGRLAGGVAHDFNNLLTIINGYGDLLLRQLKDGDPLWEPATAIHRAGERAAELTGRLLAVSRKQVVEPRLIDLNALINENRPLFERLVGAAIEIHVQLDPSLQRVLADAGQIHQVIMNLLVNAHDAMPQGGKLTVRTANVDLGVSYTATHPEIAPGPFVRLTISDTGVGIDAAIRDHIFEPFFTTKSEGEGTGLGLAMVYGIVRQSGGSIDLNSEPGRGATFDIYLPRVVTSADAPAAASGGDVALKGSETILVVEDEPQIRRLAVQLLKSLGYQVLEAAAGDDALVYAEQHKGSIHLLLTDVVMPRMSGRELASRLRATRPRLRVIYMSGYAGDSTEEMGSLGPEASYLAKPFTLETLATQVREALDQAPSATILVVDDEDAVRRLFRRILVDEGYQVFLASNGDEALTMAGNHTFDVVITDLVMPEREGIETIQTMRKKQPQLKIIAVSGAAGGRFLTVAKALGANATLAKPVSAQQLTSLVQRLLAESR